VTKHLLALLGTVIAARPTTLQSSAMVILVIGFMSASLPGSHRTIKRFGPIKSDDELVYLLLTPPAFRKGGHRFLARHGVPFNPKITSEHMRE
jgi:hypothetical protein